MYPQLTTRQLTYIKGPNYDVLRKKTAVANTEYIGWDEILQYNSQSLVQTIFSQSSAEGTPLNVDYTRFENFIRFSSAYERIKNFEYKLKLIESYQQTSSSLANSNSPNSFYVSTQIVNTNAKINSVIGAFDGFERYMYFESSSYVTNSFGEFLDMAWPKSNSTRPYTLYSATSSQAELWLDGILQSASLFDNRNPHTLRKLVPDHISEEQSDVVDSFVDMLGHYFDIQYEYVHQLPSIWDRQQKLTEGFAKELVYHIGASLGADFSNGDNFEDLWSYTLGLNSTGTYNNTLKLTGEDRTREIWKRIINNLPYLLKTKGTERGIRALINCFGIPSTILRIKEYGGPEADLDKASQYRYDRFSFMTNVGTINGNVQSITVPAVGTNAIEWRMMLAPNQTSNQVLATIGGTTISAINGNAIQCGASIFSSSIYDGLPHSFAISNGVLYVGKVDSGMLSVATGSFGGSIGSAVFGHSSLSGSVQDIKRYNVALSDREVRAHMMGPTAYFVDESATNVGGTGGFSALVYRLTAGADCKKFNYSVLTSVTSSHPDRSATPSPSTFTGFTGFSSTAINETHFLEWPDIAGNRQVGNKVRIESTLNTSTDLYPNIATQRSLQDNQPVDSPRLGVFLSPIDEVNQDIAESFGGITLDDYFGRYDDVYNDGYPDLSNIKREYLQKAQGRYKSQNYIRLLQYFNSTVFNMAKQLAPQRANMHTGLVIEPDVLTRSKVTTAKRPELEDQSYEGGLELPSAADPIGDIKIVGDGEIHMPEADIEGVYAESPEGVVNGARILSLTSKANEYNNYQVPSQGRKLSTTRNGVTIIDRKEALEDDINVYTTSYGRDKAEGSKYDFYTWVGPVDDPTVYVGSGLVSNSADFIYVPAVSEDYRNPIGLQVYNSRKSEILSPGDITYKQGGDILRGEAMVEGRGWTYPNQYVIYTGSYGQLPIARLGVRFTGTWRFDQTGDDLECVGTGNMVVPLPYAEAPDAVYEVSWDVGTAAVLQFGSGSTTYQYTSATQGTYQSRASNGLLCIRATTGTAFQNLKVSILNYPGQFQDYMVGPLASLGQRNQKYDGCKMTSPDFNEDSPDTIDGGPVVVVTEGPSTSLQVKPTVDGTYTFK